MGVDCEAELQPGTKGQSPLVLGCRVEASLEQVCLLSSFWWMLTLLCRSEVFLVVTLHLSGNVLICDPILTCNNMGAHLGF